MRVVLHAAVNKLGLQAVTYMSAKVWHQVQIGTRAATIRHTYECVLCSSSSCHQHAVALQAGRSLNSICVAA